MEIYFVRHGETNGNIAHRHQVDNTPLTFLGEKQAKAAAQQVMQYEPTHLISSRLLRALVTAQVIGVECDLVPETSENFVELDRPKNLYGRHHASPHSLWFYFLWYTGLSDKKHTGESYKDLRKRIKRAQEELKKYPDDARILVVSHAVFITFFIVHMCRARKIGLLSAIITFYKMLTMQNGQVTRVVFTPTETDRSCAWSVKGEA